MFSKSTIGILLQHLDALIDQWQPEILTMEDANARNSRRRPRIRELMTQILALAKDRKVKVTLLSRDKMMRIFFDDSKGTKYGLAKLLLDLYPEELDHRLPPKRRLWESEKRSMDIFDAVALGVAFTLISTKNDNGSEI
jgi:hypothetical protein